MVRRPLQVGRKRLFDPPSTQFLTEIELVGSGAKRSAGPLPPAGYISHHVFSSASLTLLVVVIARRISDTVLARARTC